MSDQEVVAPNAASQEEKTVAGLSRRIGNQNKELVELRQKVAKFESVEQVEQAERLARTEALVKQLEERLSKTDGQRATVQVPAPVEQAKTPEAERLEFAASAAIEFDEKDDKAARITALERELKLKEAMIKHGDPLISELLARGLPPEQLDDEAFIELLRRTRDDDGEATIPHNPPVQGRGRSSQEQEEQELRSALWGDLGR